MVISMVDKLAYFNLKETSYDMDTNSIIRKITAQIVDMHDDAIVQACIDAAKKAGIHDLILMDKKFVLDALLEKIQRSKHGYWREENSWIRCSACGTYETKYDHLGNMNDFDYCPSCGARMDGEGNA